MTLRKIIAIVILVAGALALAYGGFTYTEDRHEVNVGPLDFAVEEKETVNIPMWAGLTAVLIGGAGLALPDRKS